ncbi:Abi family protein [Microbacterium sufflavum]|uniref:Abi family protein n=1 Tax=Microbacterium sufflavum TaxID=2851649 RepID=A0ABY4IDA0_9MICO|nr:Abi family protein [Microbacterium sufflavum]UPL10696.1 Abi family protein [Microbacterium sufflavum]
MSDLWIDAWLGAARFQRYVDECSGDRTRALALYEWNVALGQSMMHDIAHFEVALRNAYDAAISASWPYRTHWLLHPDSPAVMPIWRTRDVKGIKRGSDVNFLNRKNVDDAIKRCGFGKATPGKVLAELTFGFWRQFTTKSMEKTVWVPYLHKAFPRGTSRSAVDIDIAAVNSLRNRIAHHEPLFTPTLDPIAVHRQMMHCLLLIAPDVHAHVSQTSRVHVVFAAKP